MPDTVTDKLITMRRDEIRDRYLRDYALRNPAADTAEGSAVWLDASTFADVELINHANAAMIARNLSASTARGAALDEKLDEAGTKRLPATGASGYVTITASGSGCRIEQDDEIKIGGKRYRCAVGDLYADQADVPVYGFDTGPSTDQRAGTIGKWTRPRPGLAQEATVATGGLTGGHDVESDEEAQARLRKLKASPPASGNDAHWRTAALECPGVPVEEVFTFPAVKGPGVKAIAFTLRASKLGGDRIPTALHRALMKQHLVTRFGVEDGCMIVALTRLAKTPILQVRWSQSGAGWVDATPFPAASFVRVTAVTDALSFQVDSIAEPQAGQRIALFDATTGTFKRKSIASVSGTAGGWDLVCDDALGVSDAAYVPVVDQCVSPWSTSLDLLVAPLQKYIDGCGPGEQVASFFDPGLRQRRQPPSPESWSSEISTRLIEGLFAVRAVGSVRLVGLANPTGVTVNAIPYQTPVGVATVSCNLVTLGDLAVYPPLSP